MGSVKTAAHDPPPTRPDASRPLAGRRIVITRARSQAVSLAEKIEELGGEVIEFPTIEVLPPENFSALDSAITNIRSYDWVIFTSVNGVSQFLGRLRRCQKRVIELNGIHIAAIGPETAKRLQAAGIECSLVPEQYQAEGLLDGLAAARMRGKRVLIPRAEKAREILPETLRRWGAQVEVVTAYRTVVPKTDSSAMRRLLQAGKIDMVTFTSSSTAANFARLFDGRRLSDILAGAAIACIGPITQKTVEEMGGRAAVVSKEFTIAGLVRAMADYFGRSDRGRKGSS